MHGNYLKDVLVCSVGNKGDNRHGCLLACWLDSLHISQILFPLLVVDCGTGMIPRSVPVKG